MKKLLAAMMLCVLLVGTFVLKSGNSVIGFLKLAGQRDDHNQEDQDQCSGTGEKDLGVHVPLLFARRCSTVGCRFRHCRHDGCRGRRCRGLGSGMGNQIIKTATIGFGGNLALAASTGLRARLQGFAAPFTNHMLPPYSRRPQIVQPLA